MTLLAKHSIGIKVEITNSRIISDLSCNCLSSITWRQWRREFETDSETMQSFHGNVWWLREETVWIFKESCAKQWSREIGISSSDRVQCWCGRHSLVPSAWLEGVHSMSQEPRSWFLVLALPLSTLYYFENYLTSGYFIFSAVTQEGLVPTDWVMPGT